MARRTVAQFWRELNREVQAGKEAALEEGAKVLYKATLDELARGSPGSGRRYKRGRKYHTASVSGAAPARDYGTLQRAIGMQVNRGSNPTAVVGVKNTAPYAKYLDPPKGQKEPDIGRRPFLSSAFTKNQKNVQQTISDELERHLGRLGK